MKNILRYALILLFPLALVSCNDDDDETCEQDEICPNVEVTVCCTDDECTYEYDGRTYNETEYADLVQNIDCDNAAAPFNEDSFVNQKLEAMTLKAKARM